jgi:TetR/AcrR family transcriptional regulator, transcriptional repressor for nem operon
MGDRSTAVTRGLTSRGRATRARIIDAATALMSERGVAGTRIEDVRKAAKVSGSQMTHYFVNKNSLVRAVIAWQTSLVLDESARLDTLAGLREWARTTTARQRIPGGRDGCALGSLVAELAETDALARADLAAAFQQWELALRGALRTMRDRGDLRSEADPAELALALLSALQGGMLLSRIKQDSGILDSALSSALDHIQTFATCDRSEPDGQHA